MRYRLLLVAATVIWGSSFVIVKDTTDVVNPAWIIALRFTCAAVVMAIALCKHRALYAERGHVVRGLVLGVAMFLSYYLQTVGITDTTPGKNAFLTGTYCVLVPFVAWALAHRKPNRFNVVAAVVCVAGIGLISLNGDLSIRFGDALTLGSAAFYALHIVLVSLFAPGRDIYALTVWQFAGVALCAWAVALAAEPAPIWHELGAGTWAGLAYLALGCMAVALLFQNVGQAHVPPASAALLLSLESVFGVAFSVALGAEVLTARVLAGFALVFLAIVISEVLPQRTARAGQAGQTEQAS